MTITLPDADFFRAALAGDMQFTGRQVSGLVDRGVPAARIVSELLVPTQVAVGRQWQLHEITVAAEHTATAAVDNALSVLWHGLGPSPGGAARLVVVCAEGDWHTLPSRMAAHLWAWSGWHVTFLGGSIPGPDLTAWLQETRPDAVAVTCSLPLFIPGAARVCAAAGSAGVPAVVGGLGFGPDDRPAAALGLRWASSYDGLADALAASPAEVDPVDLDSRRAESRLLTECADSLAEEATKTLIEAVPKLAAYTEAQRRSTRSDYHYLVQVLAVVALTGDDRILQRFVDWLQDVLSARGVPPDVLGISLRHLLSRLPRAATLAVTACERVLASTTAGEGAPVKG